MNETIALCLEIIFWLALFIVFYTYLGYGIVLYVLVKLRELFVKPVKRSLPASDADLPEVTLFITAFNEEDVVDEKMENSLEPVSYTHLDVYKRQVYIRSHHNANPFTLRLVKLLKQTGAKVVMEIPTYPYDQEYTSRSMKFYLLIDRCFRHQLAKHLDGIVTFSNAETIFGGKTIRISNGIDFDAIPMKQSQNDTSHELHLIGVAEVHYWHGFDRMVNGMTEYYRTNPDYKVYFHIIGPLSGEREREDILPVVRNNHLEDVYKRQGY